MSIRKKVPKSYRLLNSEDGDTMHLRYVGTYLPVDIANIPEDWIFINTAMRNSHAIIHNRFHHMEISKHFLQFNTFSEHLLYIITERMKSTGGLFFT